MSEAPLQPGLFDGLLDLELAPTMAPALPQNARFPTIQERFEAFHAANPHVYTAMRQLALGMKQRGETRWSTKAIFEILRWAWLMRTADPSGFRLNNIYTAGYARLLMEREPLLAGFFETREHRNGQEEVEA